MQKENANHNSSLILAFGKYRLFDIYLQSISLVNTYKLLDYFSVYTLYRGDYDKS